MATYSGALVGSMLVSVGASHQPIQATPFTNVVDRPPSDVLAGTDEGGGPGHSIPVSGTTYTGSISDSQGALWFDTVHITPRSKIEFGNIVGVITNEFEVFSAYRTTTTTLSSITNNLGDGTALEDTTAPQTLYPFTSILDPSSARLTPVKDVLKALPSGLATFDSTLIFVFSTGETPTLYASGNRIVVWPEIWDAEFDEQWRFKTDILEALSGKEQRVALRQKPRQFLQTTFTLTDSARQRVQSLLHGWQQNLFLLPMFHTGTKSTAAISSAATSVSVESTASLEFRVGGYAVLYQDNQVSEAVTITNVTSTSIEFTGSPTLNAYAANTRVFPGRLCFIANAVSGSRYRTNMEKFQVSWQAYDNDTGAPSGSIGSFSTHAGDVIFSGCNLMGSTQMPVQHVRNVTYVDNETGLIATSSRWDRNKRSSEKGFFMATQADIEEIRKLLIYLQGKQKPFWLPTFIEDLTPVAGVLATQFTLDINHVGFTRFIGSGLKPKKTLRVTFTDGTEAISDIQSSAEVSSTVERVTLGDAWAASKTVDEIERVEYLEHVRFNTDSFTFRYRRAGAATMVAPVITVYD